MRRLLVVVLVCLVLAVGALFAGPAWSGALLLLRPSPHARRVHDLPEDYQPRHRGGFDTATGLYIRDDEDLVLPGTPPIVFRRTYLSRYRVQREFGIGTTNNGEWYLIGDGRAFQWASLIREDGSRIEFKRITPGTSIHTALFENDPPWGPMAGARLGWTGGTWALRLSNGTLFTFKACGPPGTVCSIVQVRDSDGHITKYLRNAAGRLARIESGDRWIALEYDGHSRISRARDSLGRAVLYEYDEAHRLVRAKGWDGTVRHYAYTNRDELAKVIDPDMTVENTYDDAGRVIKQIDRFPGDPEPLVFDVTYRVEGEAVTGAEVARSDGTWTTYTFGADRLATSETWGWKGTPPVTFAYTRDLSTGDSTAIVVTCVDRKGQIIRHSGLARPGDEDRVKWDLFWTGCARYDWRVPGKSGAKPLRFAGSPEEGRPTSSLTTEIP